MDMDDHADTALLQLLLLPSSGMLPLLLLLLHYCSTWEWCC